MNTIKTIKTDGEYRVRLFVDGVYQAGADYFTTDKQDAIDTAAHMVINGGISDKTTDFARDEQAKYEEDDTELYDVCNDYSLDTLTTDFVDTDYDATAGRGGVIFTHKVNKEIHYFRGPKGLSGSNL